MEADVNNEQTYSDAIDRAGDMMKIKLINGKTGRTLDADVQPVK